MPTRAAIAETLCSGITCHGSLSAGTETTRAGAAHAAHRLGAAWHTHVPQAECQVLRHLYQCAPSAHQFILVRSHQRPSVLIIGSVVVSGHQCSSVPTSLRHERLSSHPGHASDDIPRKHGRRDALARAKVPQARGGVASARAQRVHAARGRRVTRRRDGRDPTLVPRRTAAAAALPVLQSQMVQSRPAETTPSTAGAATTQVTPFSWPRHACTTRAPRQSVSATTRSSPQLSQLPGAEAGATAFTGSSQACAAANV